MDGSSDDSIRLYHDEFTSVVQQVESLLLKGSGKGAAGDASQDEIEALWSQANDCWKQLSVEVRALPPDRRDEWSAASNAGKSRLQALRIQIDRASLDLADPTGSARNNSLADKQQQNEALLLRQNDTLDQAMERVTETEQVASGIASELASNRATLESTKQKIGEVSSLTERANGLLKSMSKKFWR
jgi:Snare region anchored in the vesicle membrane C-terminus